MNVHTSRRDAPVLLLVVALLVRADCAAAQARWTPERAAAAHTQKGWLASVMLVFKQMGR